jgi:MFS family permease
MIATAIPVAIFGPFSGILADKIDYKKILIYTNFLRVIIVLLLLFANNNVLAYLEIIFIVSALSQIFTPAESSSIPLIVPEKELLSANSMVMSTTYVTLLVGYAVAGPLLNLIGTTWLFLLCAVLFLFATGATRMLSNFDTKEIRKITIEKIASGMDKVWDEMKTGFLYIKKTKKILNPMIKLTIGWTVLGAFITLLPSFGQSVLKIDPKLVGPYIIAPAGVGMLLSALLLSRKEKINHTKIINLGFIISSIALVGFSCYSFFESVPLSRLIVLLLVVVVGFGSSMIQIPAQTLLHINSDEEKRGRVFGLSSMQLRLATSLPTIIVAAVADLTSPMVTMILLAVAIFLYSLTLIFEEEPVKVSNSELLISNQ